MDIGRIENHGGTAGCNIWRLSADGFLAGSSRIIRHGALTAPP